MSKGMMRTLVGAVLVLAMSVAGLAAYIFLGPNTAASAESLPKEEAGSAAVLKLKNFVTDLADADRARYVDVTVALSLPSQLALEEAKKAEVQLRDFVLSHLRTRTAADLAGAAGKERLAQALQKGISDLLKVQVRAVYVTDLIVQ
jgi:flagellar basal body-associated protein FliL